MVVHLTAMAAAAGNAICNYEYVELRERKRGKTLSQKEFSFFNGNKQDISRAGKAKCALTR